MRQNVPTVLMSAIKAMDLQVSPAYRPLFGLGLKRSSTLAFCISPDGEKTDALYGIPLNAQYARSELVGNSVPSWEPTDETLFCRAMKD